MRENILNSIKDDMKKYPELLLPITFENVDLDEEDVSSDTEEDSIHESFLLALSIAFDVDKKIIDEISNRDLLWLPSMKGYRKRFNAYQLVSLENDERDPIDEMFSYLFTELGQYGEPYDKSNREKQLLNEFYQHFSQKYENVEEYLNRIEYTLFLKEGELDDYKDYLKLIFKLKNDLIFLL